MIELWIGGIGLRPKRALVDPRAQDGDLFFGERVAFGGHLAVGIEAGDILDERAVSAALGDNGDAIVAAGKSGSGDIEPVTALLFLLAVTGVAVLGEDGLDVFDEVNGAIEGWRELGGFGAAGDEEQRERE